MKNTSLPRSLANRRRGRFKPRSRSTDVQDPQEDYRAIAGNVKGLTYCIRPIQAMTAQTSAILRK
jgi:hypothetical protein